MSRVDVHQHLVPEPYARWLRSHGVDAPGGRPLPSWSPAEALEFMERQGIAKAVVSLTTPGAYLGDGGDAAYVARQSNTYAAQLAADHPGRFGFFATLTLPDVDTAVQEAAHALGELGADGVMLLANSDGLYLGDALLDPLMAHLDEHGATVFVHPAQLPGPPAAGIPPFAADFLLDTTRAAFNLVKHDVPRRFPHIRFILAHGGGFVPYAAERLAITVFAETGRDLGDILDDLRGFHFDTALSASPALAAFARPGHLHYGSDWPFAPEPAVAYFKESFDV
ncbi:amidohydrolase family protein [Nonomuraea soli]|uniref:Putative TIM-barrel fold metal-dependent hydrolase n=1 Tax=Nonomuraea soli TaxID=1032476 RepID=A0A7W0CSQ4_9ACTN|nr:amidohydrolase family protein [Nonomuraea soli]MBA2896489.1 putative TIM-barrel fold metal-dependent hydrolase [Nonomuraea soli]